MIGELEMNNEQSAILPTPRFSLFISHCSLIIDLQWFADDDTPGRTEEPTEHKLQRLREEGQVVKSQELVSALGLFLPALLLLFLAPSMMRTCVEMIRFFFLRATEMDPTKDAIIVVVFFRYFLILAAPILAVALFSALFSNLVQIGFLFTTKPIVPNLFKVLPKIGQFFKRIFSIDGLYNFFKSIIKMAIIGAVSYILISSDIEKLLNLQKADVWTGLTTVSSIAIRMLLIASLLMLLLAVPDYMFQRFRFRERNKMTRYEIKEELKMYEADPQIQSRIRRRFHDLLRQNIAVAVPKADVVITNPTHLAVALQYDQLLMHGRGPQVVAMGADEMAARIRQIALEHEVPLVENKPLAWAMYNDPKIEVGRFIPEKYWNTVAVILSRVWRLNEERRRRQSAYKEVS
ncbi:MAG: flagellar biosynthesis protein FlhB [Treponema sp.]|jgi:flagellar biosynthetic protein FlhB|nr:flagellar biosynthesis protein FlhB [Treponema sp.]